MVCFYQLAVRVGGLYRVDRVHGKTGVVSIRFVKGKDTKRGDVQSRQELMEGSEILKYT